MRNKEPPFEKVLEAYVREKAKAGKSALEILQDIWARMPFGQEIELLDGRKGTITPFMEPRMSIGPYRQYLELVEEGFEFPEGFEPPTPEDDRDHEPCAEALFDVKLSDNTQLEFTISHSGFEADAPKGEDDAEE